MRRRKELVGLLLCGIDPHGWLERPAVGTFHPLTATETTAGRSRWHAIHMVGRWSTGTQAIGGTHARFVRRDPHVFLHPTGSPAFVAVNDRCVSPLARNPVLLRDGDLVQLGPALFLFLEHYPARWARVLDLHG